MTSFFCQLNISQSKNNNGTKALFDSCDTDLDTNLMTLYTNLTQVQIEGSRTKGRQLNGVKRNEGSNT